MKVVRERLLTPVGLRSLAPGEPDYKPRYYGDLRARDAAYHQGTVWAWLIGPYIDAELKLPGAIAAGCASCSPGSIEHLDEACVGQISEVFDAEHAVPAARLRRAGLERRRSPALLAESVGARSRAPQSRSSSPAPDRRSSL